MTRPRITARLRNASRFPVTLIVAPAGFGKSVALRDFIESSGIEVVRYEVRREDGTLLAFVRGLSEALSDIAPAALASFSSIQERVLASEEPVRQLADWFVEHLKDAQCTIVIDDLHFAGADPASIALLADMIERRSERIKWIIATRSDVGLPIATWVAYGRMDMPIGEDDLRFTVDEALATGDDFAPELDPQEIESLRHLTEGWPVALTIALRTRTYATDLRSAALGAREMLFRYLAEQVFAALSLQERAFALASCVFPTFSAEQAQALGATPEFVAEFRSKVAFLNETQPGAYRYHDLFRDFLEMELRRSGEVEWLRTLCAAANVLEQSGNEDDALTLYTRARSADDIVRIVETAGFSLFERGQSSRLAAALDVLPQTRRSSSALALALRAMIDASFGRFELAENAFLSAINLADDNALRLRLVHRYALELVRLDRDCTQLLEPYANMSDVPPYLTAPLLATLATGYRKTGREREATIAAERSLTLMDPARLSEEDRARILQQAAYVERYVGSLEKARAYASAAIDLAVHNGLYEIAARAYTVLYTIMRETTDDTPASLDILRHIDEYARKGASLQARMFAVAAMFTIEAERGDEDRLAQLESEIHESPLSAQVLTQAILPARALRAAWKSDFETALRLLSGTAQEQSTLERKALRAAETALYAAAAGSPSVAERELQSTAGALDPLTEYGKDALRALLIAALAHALRGHESAAQRYLLQAERALTAHMRQLRSMAQAIRSVYRSKLGQAPAGELGAALQQLRDNHLGGFALLLERLPLEGPGSEYAALTAAEREVLQMLAEGRSTKELSKSTGRSPHTIDTHIRSICRKLGCSGRREAVALATRRGWVQT